MDETKGFDADILVVGLGPMGATTALALAQYGVRVHAISRQPWVADTPRAHITNLRAVEVLRNLGVEEQITREATPWESMGDTLFTTSLTGPEIVRMRTWGTGDDRYGDYIRSSPCTMLDIPQSLVEPILVGAAARDGATISFNTEYLSSMQDHDGVNVTLRDRISGLEYVQRVRYLVGADGARSRVMQDAGLAVEGELARAGTVYAQFRGDLSQHVAHRPSILNWIINSDAAVGEIGLGLLRAVRPWDTWIAGWGFDIAKGDPDVSVETAIARIREYVGDPDFEPEVTSVAPWYVNEAFAPVLSNGRIFCGGDATHRHPPSSGLGSNTCIQDAFNLSWKLAFVVHGDASPALLESYSAERAPVGQQVVARANQSRRDYAPLRGALAQTAGGVSGIGKVRAATAEGAAARAALAAAVDLKQYEFNAQGIEMNHRYESGAVIPDVDQQPEHWQRDRDLYVQATTRPGAKLPHVWLVDAAGRRISTLDVVKGLFLTLLTGPTGTVWAEAVSELDHPRLRTITIGDPDTQDLYFEWQRAREVDEAGAVLVRPDGVVAWRAASAPTDVAGARAQLGGVISRLLGKAPVLEALR
ncbi:MAG: FAD-dependent monooxygenase [Microbacterium ginsengisoli]|nr:FAD-dependent monooxygenase [Microbacterium ginsengisoli]